MSSSDDTPAVIAPLFQFSDSVGMPVLLREEGLGLVEQRNAYAGEIRDLLASNRYVPKEQLPMWQHQVDLIEGDDARIAQIVSQLDTTSNQYFEGVDLTPASFHNADERARSNFTAENQERAAQARAREAAYVGRPGDFAVLALFAFFLYRYVKTRRSHG